MTRRPTLLLCLASLLTVPFAGAAEPTPEQAQERRILRGKLVAEQGEAADPLRIRTADDAQVVLLVEGDNQHALRDKDLLERTWEFEGYRASDGRFEVRKMFTLVDGQRHKVTYYCEICHITSYRPGRCMCCQEDVELREAPVQR